MSLSNSATYDVADQAAQSAQSTLVIQPPVSSGDGLGRLIHPSLGTYDYAAAPTHLVDIDGGPLYRPIWSSSQTLGGSVNALWSGYLADARVTERWAMGDVGAPIALLRTLWQFFANAPDPSSDRVIWAPNYATTNQYEVALLDVRAGGERYSIDRRLLSYGFAPQPIELEMKVIALAT